MSNSVSACARVPISQLSVNASVGQSRIERSSAQRYAPVCRALCEAGLDIVELVARELLGVSERDRRSKREDAGGSEARDHLQMQQSGSVRLSLSAM